MANEVSDLGDSSARIELLEETIEELRKSRQTVAKREGSRIFKNAPEGNITELEDGTEVVIAGLSRRSIAGIGDNILFDMLYFLSYILIIVVESAIVTILIALLGLLLAIGYQTVMLTNDGQTFGRKVAKIRVVMFRDGAIPDANAILKRGVVSTGLMVVPWILFFAAAIVIDASQGLDGAVAAFLLLLAATGTWLVAYMAYELVILSFMWDATGRGWHDRVAGTIVVAADLDGNGAV